MIEKIEGIVLDLRRHNDKSSVVTLYTRQRGRVAFIVSASGKSGIRNNALLRPLSVIESNVNFSNSKELNRLSSYSPTYLYEDLYYNPYKSAVAMFLADFLNRLLRNSSSESNLYDYIVDSARILDSAPARMTADFHIVFLVDMLYFAGIHPDLSGFAQGRWFDMRQGVFTDCVPPHPDRLGGKESEFVLNLMRIKYFNSKKFGFDREARNRILDMLVRYYSVHIPGMSSISTSLSVLRELF